MRYPTDLPRVLSVDLSSYPQKSKRKMVPREAWDFIHHLAAQCKSQEVGEAMARFIKLYRPAPIKYAADFKSTIKGIPCGIKVEHYSAPKHNNWGHPDDRLPDDPEEFSFYALRSSGTRNLWLETQATEDDQERILGEYLSYLEEMNAP